MTIHRKNIRLASNSQIRAQLLRNAGVDFTATPARIDEAAIKASLLAENAPPRDIADHLGEAKAVKVSSKHPDDLVIGSDQVLVFEGKLLSKPLDQNDARQQLAMLSGQKHHLISSVIIAEEGRATWRHISTVSLTMRDLSPAFINAYVDRNWPDISYCLGGYQIEAEGVRLFSEIKGDYFTILGIPLLETLSQLTLRGMIDG